MPRLTSATPKYRHHKASGQAVVTICGRDHYLGPYKSKASRLEYDRLIGEWLAAGRPAVRAVERVEISVAEVCLAFWKHAQRHYRKNGRPTGTAENYRPALSWLRKRYGRTAAVDFGPISLKALCLAMVQSGNSRRYVNDQMHRIRKVFRWAASEEMIPASVTDALATVDGLQKGRTDAREPDPVEPVADPTVELTLPHLPEVVADMVRLQRLTGARPGEIIAMRPCDIVRTGDVWQYTPAEHKTEHHGHQRTIFIGPRAQAILGKYLLRDASEHCFRPIDSERKRRLAIRTKRETPWNCGNAPGTNRKAKPRRKAGEANSNDSYRRAIARACEIAFGMPESLRKIPRTATPEQKAEAQRRAAEWRKVNVWHPNQLRHTAATDIREKFGLEHAQVTLGHSRMNVTEIYAEKNLKLAADVAREVG